VTRIYNAGIQIEALLDSPISLPLKPMDGVGSVKKRLQNSIFKQGETNDAQGM
jgi:hypothetical protein